MEKFQGKVIFDRETQIENEILSLLNEKKLVEANAFVRENVSEKNERLKTVGDIRTASRLKFAFLSFLEVVKKKDEKSFLDALEKVKTHCDELVKEISIGRGKRNYLKVSVIIEKQVDLFQKSVNKSKFISEFSQNSKIGDLESLIFLEDEYVEEINFKSKEEINFKSAEKKIRSRKKELSNKKKRRREDDQEDKIRNKKKRRFDHDRDLDNLGPDLMRQVYMGMTVYANLKEFVEDKKNFTPDLKNFSESQIQYLMENLTDTEKKKIEQGKKLWARLHKE